MFRGWRQRMKCLERRIDKMFLLSTPTENDELSALARKLDDAA